MGEFKYNSTENFVVKLFVVEEGSRYYRKKYVRIFLIKLSASTFFTYHFTALIPEL